MQGSALDHTHQLRPSPAAETLLCAAPDEEICVSRCESQRNFNVRLQLLRLMLCRLEHRQFTYLLLQPRQANSAA